MDAIWLLLALLFPLLPWVALAVIVLYGPIRNRWWRGEHPIGFALFVGAISFSAGFFGPMVLDPGANQGPLLGIFITGPMGLVLGAVWGAARWWGRQH
jgi:hypothetical protein